MKFNTEETHNLIQYFNEEKVRELYVYLLDSYETKLGINLYGLHHQDKTFQLYMLLNRDYLTEAFEGLVDSLDYTISIYNKDKDKFLEILKNSIIKRDEALQFFWEFREETKEYIKIKDNNFNFRKKATKFLKLFPWLIEDILKREGYLIHATHNINKKNFDSKKIKLYSVVKSIFMIPSQFVKTIPNDSLKGVSINQFRNIVAHSDFALINNRIYAKYSEEKNLEMSLDDAEEVLGEIYRIRMFIKLHLNMIIDFFLCKHPELRNTIKLVPETVIVDLNALLNTVSINILSFEISDYINIGEEKYSQDGEVYYSLVIESEEEITETIKLLLVAISGITPMFDSNLNMPDISDILWYLQFRFPKKEKQLNFAMGYDEIENLLKNPLLYAGIIAKKLNTLESDFLNEQ